MLPPEPHLPSSYAAAFSSALIDPRCETPAVVTGPPGKAAVKRYNVYRNNVTASLIEALVAIYPAVQRITGWAQLCYPYGASDQDAFEKLQYDLFYVKNHGLFFDLMILLQTVEVIVFGKGAR